jgi:hypothetical protein
VRNDRQTLALVVDDAVKMGALVGNPARSVKPLRATDADGVALDRVVLRQAVAKIVEQAARPPVSLPSLAPTPVAAPSSRHRSWTATRPWRTSLASWATPGPPPPPGTPSASAVARPPSLTGCRHPRRR